MNDDEVSASGDLVWGQRQDIIDSGFVLGYCAEGRGDRYNVAVKDSWERSRGFCEWVTFYKSQTPRSTRMVASRPIDLFLTLHLGNKEWRYMKNILGYLHQLQCQTVAQKKKGTSVEGWAGD